MVDVGPGAVGQHDGRERLVAVVRHGARLLGMLVDGHEGLLGEWGRSGDRRSTYSATRIRPGQASPRRTRRSSTSRIAVHPSASAVNSVDGAPPTMVPSTDGHDHGRTRRTGRPSRLGGRRRRADGCRLQRVVGRRLPARVSGASPAAAAAAAARPGGSPRRPPAARPQRRPHPSGTSASGTRTGTTRISPSSTCWCIPRPAVTTCRRRAGGRGDRGVPGRRPNQRRRRGLDRKLAGGVLGAPRLAGGDPRRPAPARGGRHRPGGARPSSGRGRGRAGVGGVRHRGAPLPDAGRAGPADARRAPGHERRPARRPPGRGRRVVARAAAGIRGDDRGTRACGCTR